MYVDTLRAPTVANVQAIHRALALLGICERFCYLVKVLPILKRIHGCDGIAIYDRSIPRG